jgi:hypothetical protein
VEAVLLGGLAVLERHAQPLAVERDGLVEVLDRNSDVIDPSEHGRMSLGDRMSPNYQDAGRMPAEVSNT